MPENVTPGPQGVMRGIDAAELLDVFLAHAGTLSPFTLARLAVCNKEFQGFVKLHIKVTKRDKHNVRPSVRAGPSWSVCWAKQERAGPWHACYNNARALAVQGRH